MEVVTHVLTVLILSEEVEHNRKADLVSFPSSFQKAEEIAFSESTHHLAQLVLLKFLNNQ